MALWLIYGVCAPKRIASAAYGSSMENEARTVSIKKDDLVSVSRALSFEEGFCKELQN